MMTDKQVRAFEKKIVKTDGCWLWSGKTDKRGYGVYAPYSNGKRIYINTHRVAYALYVSDPVGAVVCHQCDIPACVRPSHLFLGTQAENIADRDRKGRTANGVRNGSAKLTEHEVIAIRQLRTHGVKLAAIALIYPVSFQTIHKICTRKNWRSV